MYRVAAETLTERLKRLVGKSCLLKILSKR
jgi:hypothetical protein